MMCQEINTRHCAKKISLENGVQFDFASVARRRSEVPLTFTWPLFSAGTRGRVKGRSFVLARPCGSLRAPRRGLDSVGIYISVFLAHPGGLAQAPLSLLEKGISP